MPGPLSPPVLIGEAEIQARVSEMATEISADHGDVEEITLIGVLKGAFVFLADLARRLTVPPVIEFLAVASYGAGTTPSGPVRLIMDTRSPIEGRHVVIVEDIVDSGRTLRYLTELLGARQPASLRTCTLLHKPARREVDVHLDYVGFTIPDVWVVGYGLDLAERYRTLPYIARLPGERTTGRCVGT